MKNISHQFKPWNQLKGVHIHQASDDEHGNDDQCQMPSLWDIISIIGHDYPLENVSGNVGDSGKYQYPAKRGHPGL